MYADRIAQWFRAIETSGGKLLLDAVGDVMAFEDDDDKRFARHNCNGGNRNNNNNKEHDSNDEGYDANYYLDDFNGSFSAANDSDDNCDDELYDRKSSRCSK
jgi:hypothetical protein